ncbi:hypothetical protein HDV01_004287, partial [Terramyces sp. JEL0728]
ACVYDPWNNGLVDRYAGAKNTGITFFFEEPNCALLFVSLPGKGKDAMVATLATMTGDLPT